MLAWIPNLDDGASEVGVGPVGPGPTRGMMLLGIGRSVVAALGLTELLRALMNFTKG